MDKMTRSQQIIEGMNIIAKYMEGDDFIATDGFGIFCGDYDAVTDPADRKRLEEMGWFEEEDSWYRHT